MLVHKRYRKADGTFDFKAFFKKNAGCWLYVTPVLLGIIFFTIVPMATSIVFAFHDYDPTIPSYLQAAGMKQLSNPGIQNFKKIFTPNEDGGMLGTVLYSLFVTFRYTIISLAVSILGSYCVALFLNQKTKGIQAFRIIYYLPNLIPGVAGTLLWKEITAVDGGYLNMILESIGMQSYTFYNDARTVLPTMLFIGMFGWGGSCIMWLAQMQNVPKEMYESAELDGATYWQKTFRITVPMTTAMLFYVVVTSIIGGLQAFGNVYPLIDVAGREVQFIVVLIYQYAYDFKVANGMSIACALSWVLFVIIAILTAFIFKTSKWVYYGEEM
ncbi:MAG: sugar ABC transporter permease [Clostridia bacterium]|nr:sugar ABC transporter permease [Clostridia bacterium]